MLSKLSKIVLLSCLATNVFADPSISATPRNSSCTIGDECKIYGDFSFQVYNDTDSQQVWDVFYRLSPGGAVEKLLRKQFVVAPHTGASNSYNVKITNKYKFRGHYDSIASTSAQIAGTQQGFSTQNRADIYVTK